MKIVQFGLCFSPNLGDGIIAECVAHGLKERAPGAKVTHVDLSARQGFGEVVIRNREAIIAVIDTLPLFVRQRLALWKLNRLIDGVEDRWRAEMDADLAVIGGGQIFSDSNLNFPIKIARAAALLAEARIPTAVYGVGVSRNWSARGTRLFDTLRTVDLRMVGIRDEGSRDAWRAQMKYGPAPELTLDPGLLAAAHYGSAEPQGSIGLCVTDFGILAHHASGGVAGANSAPVDFYVEVVQAAVRNGRKVTLFCNGAAEDVALLSKVAGAKALAAARTAGDVLVPDAPRTPGALVAIIAGCDAVIAHRLHACIVAYSYGRPIVGLGWDVKLQSFFEVAGVAESFSSDPAMTPEAVAAMAEEALAKGLDQDRHADLTAQAWDGIDRLLACATKAAPAA